MKGKGKKRDKRDNEAKSVYIQTEWVLCSEDWRDIVIMYVPQINDIAIEDNFAEISQEEMKKAYKQKKSTDEESKMIAYVKFTL